MYINRYTTNRCLDDMIYINIYSMVCVFSVKIYPSPKDTICYYQLTDQKNLVTNVFFLSVPEPLKVLLKTHLFLR